MERRSTILLLEDNADDELFFERALREGHQSYDVHIARSGEEAIEYLQRACRGGDVPGYPVPKFIIMDNNMPRIAGSDFLRWVAENRIYEVVPTVILSGSDRPSEVKLAFQLGVHGYFVKPAGKEALTQMLKLIFHYWAESSVPPVKEFQITAPGEQWNEKRCFASILVVASSESGPCLSQSSNRLPRLHSETFAKMEKPLAQFFILRIAQGGSLSPSKWA